MEFVYHVSSRAFVAACAIILLSAFILWLLSIPLYRTNEKVAGRITIACLVVSALAVIGGFAGIATIEKNIASESDKFWLSVYDEYGIQRDTVDEDAYDSINRIVSGKDALDERTGMRKLMDTIAVTDGDGDSPATVKDMTYYYELVPVSSSGGDNTAVFELYAATDSSSDGSRTFEKIAPKGSE